MTDSQAPGLPVEQNQRVEALLATVKNILSSLSIAHAALESEVLLTLERGTGDLGTGTAEGRSVLAQLTLENAKLREALDSRAVIEQAKGVLMVRHGCGPDQAFEFLGAMARRQHRKVRLVAAWIVERAAAKDLPAHIDGRDAG